jgi:nucleoside-diphosphate-sugar epimerase
MRCLVTGGAGFIGSHLTDLLINEEHTHRILARRRKNARRVGANPVGTIPHGQGQRPGTDKGRGDKGRGQSPGTLLK